MNQKQTACDSRLIALFLDQQLSDEEQAALEEHLSQCEKCRRALDDSAADAEVWSEARQSLEADDLLATESDAPAVPGQESVTAEGPLPHHDGPPLSILAPTDDPHMLGRLGHYEIVGLIGRGGMGWVLKGFDALLNRFVAIKVLAPHLAASGSARKRFAREAQAAAAVVHDNVISIHSVAEWNGAPYLVMPYVRGESLEKRLAAQGPLGVTEILRIGMQTASGLAAAHAQGLVHRDIKPANILLEMGVERLKITDFGLARAVDDASLTRTGVIAGTPQYMSPEQARGEPVDGRSDLFSLGSVLYAISTGRPPFRAETSYGILRRITDTQPRPIGEINPEIPVWLAAIIAKLHAKDPAARFQSAKEVADLLGNCLAHLQQPSVVPLPEAVLALSTCKPSGRKWRWSSRRVRSIAAAGAVAVVLLGGASTVWWLYHNRPENDLGLDERGTAAPSAPARVGQPPQQIVGQPPSAVSGDSAQPGTAVPRGSQWHDGLAEQILDLNGQIDQLERQSEQFWSDVDTSSPTEDSP